MKKKKGFTLVELLAVIVILAVILIIAMPKISDVIKNSKESSLETTAKLIASQAEKKYTENQVLDGSSAIKCSDVAKLNENDYESCNITFDSKGNAKVSIVGKGKFEGMAVCNANKNSASISSDCSTNANYFSYEDVNDSDYGIVKTTTMSSFEVEDVGKCKTYLMNLDGAPEEVATTLCNGGSITIEEQNFSLKFLLMAGEIPLSDFDTAGLKVEIMDIIIENVEVKDVDKCKSYVQTKGKTEEDAATVCTGNALSNGDTIQKVVVLGYIPLMDYETAGLNVTYRPYTPSIIITGYNIEGGTDVVIPSQIDGKTVVAIADYAFTTQGVIPTEISSNYTDYKVSFLSNSLSKKYVVRKIEVDYSTIGLGVTSVVIPNTVMTIGSYAFSGNKLANVIIPNSVITIRNGAFYGNNLTNVEIPSSITEIGSNAFANNPNIVITNNSSIENTVGVWNNIIGSYGCGGGAVIDGNVIRIIQGSVVC